MATYPKPQKSFGGRWTYGIVIMAFLFVLMPFLFWNATWFGRPLSDAQIGKALADRSHPRQIQHALTQIETRIEARDASVLRWYPAVVTLAADPVDEIRVTDAWVMGQDNKSEEFHRALLSLLSDNDPLVRRNAALQLVRFGDGSGRPELRSMLQSFEVKSPVSGAIVSLLPQGSKISAGGLLARIREPSNAVQEFRSPVDGAIGRLAIKEGEAIAAGQSIVWLTPDRATVSDALQALAYVGTKEDLAAVESCVQVKTSAEISQQAEAAARAIKGRAN